MNPATNELEPRSQVRPMIEDAKSLAGRRILVHTFESTWPVANGYHVRFWQTVDTLVDLGAEVHLLAAKGALPKSNRWPEDAAEQLKRKGVTLHLSPAHYLSLDFWWAAGWQLFYKKLRGVVWWNPASGYYYRPQLLARWTKLLSQSRFDAVLVNYANWYRLLRVAKTLGVPTVMEMHELQARQFVARMKLANRPIPSESEQEEFRTDELDCLRVPDLLLAINREEGDYVREQLKTRVTYLPMCLHEPARAHKPIETDLLVVGSQIENNKVGLRQFLSGAWPEIQRLRPGTKLTVCGGVGDVEGITGAHITWHRFAPELEPHYLGTKIAVLTTVAGAGVKIKTIEALAYGCCILGHRHCFGGIPFESGEHGIAVDNLGGVAEVIVDLLDFAPKRDRLGRNAHGLYAANFSFDKSRKELGRAFHELFEAKANPL